nr:unnamed protein product [Digitaria exilis]
MRTGGCTVQQALTPEAAVVVKQAVTLARRRGNAQVTPLHVASAMLHQQPPPPSSSSSSSSTTTGLLRAACLRSHSHPLHCCYYYCAVEHAVAEVRALACRGGDGVWLVGYGTYQSYMRCRAGQPSLESLWGLQTLAVPAGSLALSLNCVDDSSAMAVSYLSSRAKCEGSSGNGSVSRCMSLLDAGGSGQPTAVASAACCGACSDTKCGATKELARSVLPASTIPPWLQHCRNQEPSHCKKWSLTCGDTPSHSHHRTPVNLSTVVSPSSSSVSSYEQHYHHLHQPYQPWLVEHPWTRPRCGTAGQVHIVVVDDDVKLVNATIKVNNKSHDSSASNGSVEQVDQCGRSKFKELSAENLKVLCSALEKEVPWQAELAPEIASTVLQCRSGMARTRRTRDVDVPASSRPAVGPKEDTWLLFLGGDAEGKVKVARELARLVFGSRKSFVSVAAATTASSSSPARSDSADEHHHRKRPRSLPEASNNNSNGLLERLYEAVRDNPHRVIMVDDVEQAGGHKGILEAIEMGFVRSHGGDVAALGDAIIVLSCESFDAKSRTSSPPTTKKAKTESEEKPKEEVITATATASPSSSCFDLNMSVEDDDDMDEMSRRFIDDAGLLKAVDRAFFFKRPNESSVCFI